MQNIAFQDCGVLWHAGFWAGHVMRKTSPGWPLRDHEQPRNWLQWSGPAKESHRKLTKPQAKAYDDLWIYHCLILPILMHHDLSWPTMIHDDLSWSICLSPCQSTCLSFFLCCVHLRSHSSEIHREFSSSHELVGGFNPLKNISQLGWWFSI